MNVIKQQQAMTLVEVVCSVVIIGIILISFAQLIINSNKTTSYNNEKLVTINLADAALAKLQGVNLTKNPSITNVNQYFLESNGVPSSINLNGNTYRVTYNATQGNDSISGGNSEKVLNLVKVIVTVEAPGGKKKSSTEGYVTIE